MVYGANGYTGKLVAELAVKRGELPVLAGRTAAKVAPLADELGLEYRIFDLGDPTAVRDGLDGMTTVAHCAGPFSATAAPMVDGCLAAGTHYVDITGEVDVFEAIFARNADAERAGVVLLPGAGFDVVPSDCLAAMLAGELPDATELDLAFVAGGGISPGTLRTTVEGMGTGGRARVDGKLVTVPVAHRSTVAELPSGPKTVVSIPWGDLATAYRSTGIPNITTFTRVPAPPKAIAAGQRLFGPIMRSSAGQRVAKNLVGRIPGPSEKRRAGSRTELWGRVRDANGRSVSRTLVVPNTYTFTADAVVRVVERLGKGGTPAGAHTPSSAFGADFVRGLDGVTVG
ncbi:saccharopine dehydrogenase (NAD+, L-lysine-forming) [Herbihabitans rhizosphaerae]|uniref:Saccharopine dehydrogenase (NAD+, L-lysine-forming) n=2 Tax=Herbihabitans rhizosphaerae TaxID=1872711 RepID=A0A4Q7KQU8_9PSEU|nr:saccharopine dehydrogenase (NAD+, L-lysine-forming) [Herbihabitans rhizosphaerae]